MRRSPRAGVSDEPWWPRRPHRWRPPARPSNIAWRDAPAAPVERASGSHSCSLRSGSPLQLLAPWPAPLTPAFDGPWRYDTSIFAYEGALVRQGAHAVCRVLGSQGPAHLSDQRGRAVDLGRASLGHLADRPHHRVARRGAWLSRHARRVRRPAALLGSCSSSFALGGFESGTNMTEEYALPLAWGAALVLVRWTRRARRGTRRWPGLRWVRSARWRSFCAEISPVPRWAAVLTIAIVLLRERRFGALARMAFGTMIGASIVGAAAPRVARARQRASRLLGSGDRVQSDLYPGGLHAAAGLRDRGDLARHCHRAAAAPAAGLVGRSASAAPLARARAIASRHRDVRADLDRRRAAARVHLGAAVRSLLRHAPATDGAADGGAGL